MSEIRTALMSTLVLVVLVCCLYPLAVRGAGLLIFPRNAAGSLITRAGTITGSELIGQCFTGPRYFHTRPSAAGKGYDAANSGGSNLGPLSKHLRDTVAERVAAYRQENGLGPDIRVPADAVTASGSGLDPHISVRNALLQAPRVAHAAGMNPEAVRTLIHAHTEAPDALLFGCPRVNVLTLNIALHENR